MRSLLVLHARSSLLCSPVSIPVPAALVASSRRFHSRRFLGRPALALQCVISPAAAPTGVRWQSTTSADNNGATAQPAATAAATDKNAAPSNNAAADDDVYSVTPESAKAPAAAVDPASAVPATTTQDASASSAVAESTVNESKIQLREYPPAKDMTKGPPNMILHRAPKHPDAGGTYFPVTQVTDAKAAELRTSKIYTMQEYVEKEQREQFGDRKITEEILTATDSPKWLLYSLAFMIAGSLYVVMCVRLRTERSRFDPKLRAVHTLDVDGGPTVGGPFELEDLDGNKVTEKTFLGKWTYLYFGFTHCPDVCPQEMAKLTRLITTLDKKIGPDMWQPIFITIDPKRDTKPVLKEYLSEFHHRILGLTGTPEQIEKAAREYRVYFAVPDEFDNNPDYLIDHSIIMYLMDPQGKFCDYTTKEFTWFESYSKLLRRIIDYEREKNPASKDFNEDVANLHSFSSKTDIKRMQRFAAGDSTA